MPASERDPRVDKHEVLLEKLVEQQIRFEEMMKVQIRRVDAQEEAISQKNKADNTRDLDIARTIEGMKTTFSIIKWFATLSGGFLVIEMLKTIFVK